MLNGEESSLFKVAGLKHQPGEIAANLVVDKHSSIFSGHFPGQPVVPGACLLQLVKDVLENVLGYSVLQKKALSIKFISMITPDSAQPLALHIAYQIQQEGSVNVTAKVTANAAACFKLQAVYHKR